MGSRYLSKKFESGGMGRMALFLNLNQFDFLLFSVCNVLKGIGEDINPNKYYLSNIDFGASEIIIELGTDYEQLPEYEVIIAYNMRVKKVKKYTTDEEPQVIYADN